MRKIYKSDGSSIILQETEFLNILNKFRESSNIETLQKMIELSSFYIDGEEYKFRYDENVDLDIYDLYREYIDQDGNEGYSIKNPDNYKIATIYIVDGKFKFKLKCKH